MRASVASIVASLRNEDRAGKHVEIGRSYAERGIGMPWTVDEANEVLEALKVARMVTEITCHFGTLPEAMIDAYVDYLGHHRGLEKLSISVQEAGWECKHHSPLIDKIMRLLSKNTRAPAELEIGTLPDSPDALGDLLVATVCIRRLVMNKPGYKGTKAPLLEDFVVTGRSSSSSYVTNVRGISFDRCRVTRCCNRCAFMHPNATTVVANESRVTTPFDH